MYLNTEIVAAYKSIDGQTDGTRHKVIIRDILSSYKAERGKSFYDCEALFVDELKEYEEALKSFEREARRDILRGFKSGDRQ